jgi:hypothetical protein
VDILINNATGWVPDTFSPTPQERFGHQQVRVSAETIDRQFAVDARSSALLIAEFERRHRMPLSPLFQFSRQRTTFSLVVPGSSPKRCMENCSERRYIASES